MQSAAVVIADAREGRSRRADGITANINVCEHPEPVRELRRIYDGISQTLGYRTLQAYSGADVWQLKVILHALGHYRSGERQLARGDDASAYTPETVAAVNTFRASEGLAGPDVGAPAGLVDEETVVRLWAALERVGKAGSVREQLLDLTAVRR